MAPTFHTGGRSFGLLIGDGTLKNDKAILSAWVGKAAVNAGDGGDEVHVLDRVIRHAHA